MFLRRYENGGWQISSKKGENVLFMFPSSYKPEQE